ncbi:MAG: hypothetical protein PHN75_08080, partial [Syntrophales bacterium]|nr:hypothetical protein [Syntrophales bacterium]
DAFSFATGMDRAVVRSIEKALGERLERRTLEDFNYKASAGSVEIDDRYTRARQPEIRTSSPKRQEQPAKRWVKSSAASATTWMKPGRSRRPDGRRADR